VEVDEERSRQRLGEWGPVGDKSPVHPLTKGEPGLPWPGGVTLGPEQGRPKADLLSQM
jgi:hypothetical protein